MSEEKKERKPRATMSIEKKYDLMTMVKFEYAKLGVTDTEFARVVSEKLGTEIKPSTVKYYREEFGIEQIKAAPVSELKARIAELEAKLAAAGAG